MGVTGSGKTHELRRELRASSIDRLLVWDVKGDFEKDATIAGNRWPSLRALLRHLEQGAPLGREIVHARSSEGVAFLRLAYRCGQLRLVVDELTTFLDASSCDEVEDLCFRGRDRGVTAGIDFDAVTQRPNRIPLCLYQAREIHIFRVDNGVELDFLRRQLLLDEPTCARISTFGRGERHRVARGFTSTGVQNP